MQLRVQKKTLFYDQSRQKAHDFNRVSMSELKKNTFPDCSHIMMRQGTDFLSGNMFLSGHTGV